MTSFKNKIGVSDVSLYDGKNRTFARTTSTGGSLTVPRLGNIVDVLAVYGDGTTPAEADLLAAIANIGTTEACLELAPGSWPITANLTPASNFTFRLRRGAVFTVSNGITLDLSSCYVFPEEATWTAGAGTVTTVPENIMLPGAFGKMLVSTDDTTPNFLASKLAAGSNITLTASGAGNETLTVAVDPAGTILAALAAKGCISTMRVYATPGSDTWTKPTGLIGVLVYAVGGGGGGGGADGTAGSPARSGGGGGGGGCGVRYIAAATCGATETVTVGGGGAGGANTGAPGQNGTNSSFGALVAGWGGDGAAGTDAEGDGGDGGESVATGGLTIYGNGGEGTLGKGQYCGGMGGGGAGPFGGGGGRGIPGTAGEAGQNYGGGGGGCGNQAPGTGGAGGGGVVVVIEYVKIL